MALDYLHFSRRAAQFDHLSAMIHHLLDRERALSDSSMARIERLNYRRIEVHKKLGELNGRVTHICRECNEHDVGCCKRSAEHYFSAIDYWLRRCSPNPVADYAGHPPPSCSYFAKRRVLQIKSKVMKDRDAKSMDGGERCVHLGANGCKLHIHDRPAKCLIATCPKFRRAMDNQTKREYRRLIREMYRLSLEVFDLMKSEARLPRSYGRTSLFFTI